MSKQAKAMCSKDSRDNLAKLGGEDGRHPLLLAPSLLADQLHPATNGSEGKPSSKESKHRHVESDADIPAATAEQVEEETLVESLQQVVQTSECALHQSPQGVKVSRMSFSTVHSSSFQSYSFNAESVEETMIATRNASGLPSHHVKQSLKTSGVACVGVWPAVVFHPLEHGVHPLPHHQPVHQVDKIKVGQLTVEPEDLDIDVGGELCRNLKVNSCLNTACSGWKWAWCKDTLTIADPMVALQPGLSAEELMLGDQENDVLGPIDLGPEKLGNREKHSNASIGVLMR